MAPKTSSGGRAFGRGRCSSPSENSAHCFPPSRIRTVFIEGGSLMQLNVVSYWRLPVASTSFTCRCMRDSRGFSVSPSLMRMARPSHQTAHSATRMLVLLGQFPVPWFSLLSRCPLEGGHSGWFSKLTDSMRACVHECVCTRTREHVCEGTELLTCNG